MEGQNGSNTGSNLGIQMSKEVEVLNWIEMKQS